MLQHNLAYSLIESLLVMAIIGIITTVAVPALNDFLSYQKACLTLDQLQQILRLARSQAIANNNPLTICGSSNGYSCNNSWRGVLLEANTGIQYFDLRLDSKTIILFTQSGKMTNKVEIQANGMLKTNGHFSYKSLKPGNTTQFNLYFNKALKMYRYVGG